MGENEANGFWIAYYPDFSGFNVFNSEIDALRFGVDNSMQVKFLRWGEGRGNLNS